MARLPRLILPNYPHHVVQRGNDRQLIFREQEDYGRFLGWLRESARQYKVALHAYALLPDRIDLLVTPLDEGGLAQMMQRLGRFYVPWYNAKYQRSGSLFEGRFRTSLVEAGRYLLACSRYIELGPVRANLAQSPAHYPWSSYAHHAGTRTDPLITDHSLYWTLGNTPFQREAAWLDLAEQGVAADEIEQIETASAKGWPLASDAFKAELERTTRRQILPARRGRPPKLA
jgi:putative transposase